MATPTLSNLRWELSEMQRTGPILVVEDDPSFGPMIMRMLDLGGYEATLALSAESAQALLAKQPFALVICDLNLPGISGLELLEELAGQAPDLAFVVATGISDPQVGTVATERGAYGYLIKPFDRAQLLITIANALHRRDLELRSREHGDLLKRTVELRTRELRTAVADLHESRRETITRLMRALEVRDGDTGAHVERIGRLAESLARWAGMPEEFVRMIGLAAPMHDVGKIAIPDQILLKPGALDPHERSEIERHPEIGEQIPIEGRIVAIVDVFDALHSDRCYRPALESPEALQIMRDERGSHFDPALLDCFIEHYDEAMAIIESPPVAA